MTARRLVTRTHLANRLGCSVRLISQLEADGVIVATVRGKGGRGSLFDAKVASVAYRARVASSGASSRSLREAQAERHQWEAKLAEQRHDVRAGRLLTVDDVSARWAPRVTALRTLLLASSTTHADRIHGAAVIDGADGTARALADLAAEAVRALTGEVHP